MILSQNEDTIVALATPAGVGAVAVIRVSGPQSIQIVDKIFLGKKRLFECDSHTIHYGKIISKSNKTIDDVLVSIFKAPKSYTGEDSIEISSHGSNLIVEKIIERLLFENTRLAEEGEFTKRAFLNGKLDLSQAEAVADIINSRTEASLRGARNQLDGLLSKKVNWLRDVLLHTSSLIELELDFAEEDVEFMSSEEILKNISTIQTEIEILMDSYSFGKVIKDGVNVVLVGKPNVGKSSLLNYLLKEARAIVSDVPGTTRDIIREELSIDGILFMLYDTAGLRAATDEIEKEGVARSKDAIQNADIVLFMSDVFSGFDLKLYSEILKLSDSYRILTVLNKIDIQTVAHKEFDVGISAITGEGIGLLFSKLKEKAIGSHNYTEKTAIVSNLRHYNALIRANNHLTNAKLTIDKNMSGEFIAADLRNAEDALNEIVGRITTDDILNNIFKKFCIGK
jgi:tRNA modification GTPase